MGTCPLGRVWDSVPSPLQLPILLCMAMNKLLGPEAGLPCRKLGVALVCEVDVVKAELFDEAGPVEDVPDLFGDSADDEEAACGFEKIVERDDGKAHGSVHVVDRVEPEDDGLDVAVFGD